MGYRLILDTDVGDSKWERERETEENRLCERIKSKQQWHFEQMQMCVLIEAASDCETVWDTGF
jgi:hypothetical protein